MDTPSIAEAEPDAAPLWPYLVALVLLVGLGLGFGLTVREVRHQHPDGFDQRAVVWASRQREAHPVLTGVFRAATWFGNPEVSVPASLALGAFLLGLARRKVGGLGWREAPYWLVVSVVGWALNRALKSQFRRERPALDLRAVMVDHNSFSFPSGHAAFAGVFFAYLAILLAQTIPARYGPLRWLSVVACILLAAMVAGSRVWLGVHYPTDVLGGLLIGAGWVLAAFLIRAGWGHWRRRPRRVAGP